MDQTSPTESSNGDLDNAQPSSSPPTSPTVATIINLTRQTQSLLKIATRPTPEDMQEASTALEALNYTSVAHADSIFGVGETVFMRQDNRTLYFVLGVGHSIEANGALIHAYVLQPASLSEPQGRILVRQEHLRPKAAYAVDQTLRVNTPMGYGTATVKGPKWDAVNGWQYAFKRGEDALWIAENALRVMVSTD